MIKSSRNMEMVKFLSTLVLLFACICLDAQQVSGVWTLKENSDEHGIKMVGETVMTLNQDGTCMKNYVLVINADLDDEKFQLEFETDINGTWTLSGRELTLTYDSKSIKPYVKKSNMPNMVQNIFIRMVTSELKAASKKPMKYTIEQIDKDTLAIDNKAYVRKR